MSEYLTRPSPAATTSPPRSLSTELADHVGESVRVAGWLHRRRLLKSVAFAVVRDRLGLCQVVVDSAAQRGLLESISEESVIEVVGEVTANSAAPGGAEIVRPRIDVLSEAEPPPFDLYRPALRANLPTLLDHAPAALRHPQRAAVFEIAAAAVHGFRAGLEAAGFTEVHTPKIVDSATESGANVFSLDYFGRQAYLAQSPQFYKQALVGVFERVFEVGPVFRAEPHDTVRHLAQYTSLDAELGFVQDWRDVAQTLRQALSGMLAAVGERAAAAVSRLDVTLPSLPESLPSIHFCEVLELIASQTGEDLSGVEDLAPAHERRLGQWAQTTFDSDFVCVWGYPMRKRPFYTAGDPARPGYSDSFDLLFRGTELVTGGRRLHLHRDYEQAIRQRGESPQQYEAYLAAFRHGMPPHGGFAVGLERFVSQLAGISNVREATLFPRDLHRLSP